MYNCARGSLPASAGASSSRTPMPPGSATAELDAPAGAGADACSMTRAKVARIRQPSRLTSRMGHTTYRTEWVIVAVYTAAAMPPGTAMLIVGFQAAELSPVIPVAVTAGLAPVRLPGLFAV